MKATKLFIFSTVAALSVLPLLKAGAEISEVSMTVKGLSCPFCVYGLEKKLKNVEAVENVQIDLKTGLTVLDIEEGSSPEFSTIAKAVKKAGFTPGEIKITAVGKIAFTEDRAFLKLRDSEREFHLFDVSAKSANGLSEATRTRLMGLAQKNALVAVTGSVRGNGAELSAERIEEVPSPAVSEGESSRGKGFAQSTP